MAGAPVAREAEVPPVKKDQVPAQADDGPWFEDPLGELQKNGVDLSQLPLPTGSNERPTSANSTAAVDQPTPQESPNESTPAVTAAESMKIDPEIVQSAIKRAMLNLRQNLQNATIYGTQYKEVQAYAEELAVLVVLAARDASPPSWSRHSPALRDLGIEISQAARDLSPEAYKKAASAFDSIDQLFQGNIPDGIPTDGTLEVPYSEFAHQLPLMRRLEIAQKLLKDSSMKESDLKRNADLLIEEGAVAGYLMQVMMEPGFSSADEAEYQAYAKSLIAASVGVQSAVREGKFGDLATALGAIGKSCNDCHQDYRFNSE